MIESIEDAFEYLIIGLKVFYSKNFLSEYNFEYQLEPRNREPLRKLQKLTKPLSIPADSDSTEVQKGTQTDIICKLKTKKFF